MQLERLVAKAMTRLAKSGFAGLRQTAPATAGDVPKRQVPRGSGSWANEWAGAKSAVERAKSLALPGRKRAAANAAADLIPEGTIKTRPLMSIREVKLHNWIADRLEAEAPTCSLHSGVALGAFLTSATAHETHDPLCGLVANMLIADENGQPVAALIRENTADPKRHLLLLDALLDADLPIVDIPSRPSLSGLWAEISQTLPKD